MSCAKHHTENMYLSSRRKYLRCTLLSVVLQSSPFTFSKFSVSSVARNARTMSRRTRNSTTMPPGSSKNKKGGGTDLVCDLCCDTLEKGQDILKCEGSCGCNVHRYCAGVTKSYFEELVKGSTPFVCQYCALNVYKNIVQQLQDEVASLKSELAETKGLCERLNRPISSYRELRLGCVEATSFKTTSQTQRTEEPEGSVVSCQTTNHCQNWCRTTNFH